jgi:arylsulfatase A
VAELQPRTVLSITTDLSRAQAAKRGRPEGARLVSALQAALRLPPRAGVPDYRILRPTSGRSYPKKFAATYAVETEPGITALVYRLSDASLMSRPPREGKRALLYLAHASADAELRTEPLIADLIRAEPAVPFFAADLRGLGESQPTTGNYTSAYGSDYFYAAHGTMYDTPTSPSAPTTCCASSTGCSRSANIVVIFVDDMGYADIGPFGGRFPTPNLDRMAKEGMRFVDFACRAPVCSASRAALLTGCYHRASASPARSDPTRRSASPRRDDDRRTLQAEGLRDRVLRQVAPRPSPEVPAAQHGFDEYFGLPYSNDMWPLHPAYAPPAGRQREAQAGLPAAAADRRRPDRRCRGHRRRSGAADDVVHRTRGGFVERHKDQPFFLYLPHSMVHVPLFVSEKFAGKSGKQGLFGDVVMEIDWSVGEVLDTLQRLGLDDDTLVLFTSDNGPWLSYGDHAGSAGAVARGQGHDVRRRHARTDHRALAGPHSRRRHLPRTSRRRSTCCRRSRSSSAPNCRKHKIDGHDISPLLFGEPGAKSPHEVYCCYYAGRPAAGGARRAGNCTSRTATRRSRANPAARPARRRRTRTSRSA